MKRLLCLLTLGLTACGPRYDRLEVELYSTPPTPVRVSGNEFEIPVGISAAISVAPVSDARFEYYEDDEVVLDSDDRETLRVDPTDNERRFVLTGVSPGKTCVWVEVLGEREECIPAVVE